MQCVILQYCTVMSRPLTPCAMLSIGGDYMATRRRDSGGRPPYGSEPEFLSERLNLSLPHDLNVRLNKFCEDEERARSWAVQKALDKWLTEKGY